jgi:hypothetical protein
VIKPIVSKDDLAENGSTYRNKTCDRAKLFVNASKHLGCKLSIGDVTLVRLCGRDRSLDKTDFYAGLITYPDFDVEFLFKFLSDSRSIRVTPNRAKNQRLKA